MRRTARRLHPVSKHGGKPPRGSTLVLAALLLAFLPVIGLAQQEGSAGDGDMGRMIMPTEDAKVLRLVRPTVAALQAKLARMGHFEGAINGLYGPSTREAVAAFQEEHGGPGSGWPDLTFVLRLMGMKEELAGHLAEGVELPATPGAGARGPSILPGSGELAGDPQPAKQIQTTAARMAAETDHARALQTLRALVAGVQLRLAEAALYSGAISGLPEEPGTRAALVSWQRTQELEPTGELDLPTSLRLFGLDPERAGEEPDTPIMLETSPVAPDEKLMRESLNRFSSPFGSDLDEDTGEETSDGGG